MSRPKQLDLKAEDLEALLARVEKGILQEGDYEIIRLWWKPWRCSASPWMTRPQRSSVS